MHQIPWACSTWCRYSRLPIWMSYRTYRSVCYRHRWRTQLTEVCGTGMKVCTGNSATGIYVVPNLPNYPVPVMMSYRTYRSVRCQYQCRTERTEFSVPVIQAPSLGMHPTEYTLFCTLFKWYEYQKEWKSEQYNRGISLNLKKDN